MSEVDRFEAFVLAHQDLVYATAVRILGNRREAEDVAQDAFLKAFQHFGQIGDSPGAAGWLKTVTTNLCLNHLSRYRSRWRLFSEMQRETEEEDAVEYESTIAAEGSVATDLENADEQRRLTQALHRLPAHQRVPLVLFHFDRMSYQDIAARLGVSLAKIKTDIHRGREVLRLQLATDHGSR